jgi:hypothetical protein
MKTKDNRPMILKGFIVPDYATLSVAPTKTKRYGIHWQVIVGIGSDHVAFITIDDEALKALQAGEHVNIR